MNSLKLTNSLTRKKEIFKPINSNKVSLYACGPTVYDNPHVGNARALVVFDLLFRILIELYGEKKVNYVRNITDVGHLEDDFDDGEDRIAKKARLENIEPMEVVKKYSDDFHKTLREFKVLPPNIEPTATGHIIEQIDLIIDLANFRDITNSSVNSTY